MLVKTIIINDNNCILVNSFMIDTSFNLTILLALRKERLPSKFNRYTILKYILNNPGCSVSDINRQQKIPRGTTRYHIRRLEKEGKIVLRKVGKYLRIYPDSPSVDEDEKSLLHYIRNTNYRKILCMILNKGGVTNSEISRKCGMDRSLTYRYLKRLLSNNIVSSYYEGKTKGYYIKKEIGPVLTTLLTNHPVES